MVILCNMDISLIDGFETENDRTDPVRIEDQENSVMLWPEVDLVLGLSGACSSNEVYAMVRIG